MLVLVLFLAYTPPPKRPCKCSGSHRYTWVEAARLNFYCNVDTSTITCEIKK